MRRFYEGEGELRTKDYINEKAAVVSIARGQIETLKDGVSALREAAIKAERLSKTQMGVNYPQYYSIMAQIALKRAEFFEAMRRRAELVLTVEPAEVIITRRNEAAGLVEKMSKEVDELEKRAIRVRAGQGQ